MLGSYAMKKKANPPSNLVQGSKSPVVVVRSEKPSPKVIRPKKEGIFLNQSDPMDLNFQHTKKAHSNLNQIDLNGEGNVSGLRVVENWSEEGGDDEAERRVA